MHTTQNPLARRGDPVNPGDEHLLTIIENLAEGLAVSDLNGQLLHFNRAALALHGFSNLAEARQHLSDFTKIFILSSSAGAILPLDQWPLARILRGETLRGQEVLVRRVHSDWQRTFNYGGTLVRDREGNPLMAVVTISDITERQQAEMEIRKLNATLEQRVAERTAQLEAANAELQHSRAELKSLFESLPGLYLILTPGLKIVAASDAYLKATMTTRERILGRRLFEVFPDNPDDPAATGESNLRASLNRVLQTAAPHTMAIQKYDVRRPDGVFEEHYWSPVNSPVLGAGGQVEYIIHRVEQVTDFVRQKSPPADNNTTLHTRMEQMEAEIFKSSQMVQAANQQLEAANKELEAFSYSVSHDLRAPLRHVAGYANLLAKHLAGSLDAKGQRFLDTISQSARRMGALIDDLLVFSRMGRVELRQREVRLEVLVQEALDDLQQDLAGRNIEWQYQPLPAVQGDPAMLRQVFANLLSNAIKYSRPRNPARIEIGTQPASHGEVVVFVRDNGVGFDPAYQGKLFRVFQRLHGPEQFEGTGVGLANVQRVITRHGGRVWAEGQVDQGATFYFSLPQPSSQPK